MINSAKIVILTSLFVFLYNAILIGQAHTGLLCSEERYQSIDLLPSYSGEKYNEIPLRVNLRPYCPIAKDQGELGSCVGWAVGYAGLTINRAICQNIKDIGKISRMANSAAYIYNQIKLDGNNCIDGAYIEDALVLLQTQGDCLESTFNFTNTDCNSLPKQTAVTEAQNFTIKDYATLFPIDAPEKEKIGIICKTLATKVPVIVGIEVSDSFWKLGPGQQLWTPKKEEVSRGYHAMVLVGYDNIEKKFELFNSFGPSWGDQGFIKISFNEFARRCKFAYVLSIENNVPPSTTPITIQKNTPKYNLSGAFVFRRPVGYIMLPDGNEAPFFEEVTTNFDDASKVYELADGAQAVGDVFQLVARQIPSGHYVYVFSYNPDKEIKLHFPKAHQANFVLSEAAEIAIPSEETVLQLGKAGFDFLCILYGDKKVEDIGKKLKQMENEEGSFMEKLQKVFSEELISDKQIKWSATNMEFQAISAAKTGAFLAPIVLKVYAE